MSSTSPKPNASLLSQEEYFLMMAEFAADSEWMRSELSQGDDMALSRFRRTGMCRAFAPVLNEKNLVSYLAGTRSQSWPHEEVPIAITLRAGFWFVLPRPVRGARMVLITTAGDLPPLRSETLPVGQLLYLSQSRTSIHLGEVVDGVLVTITDSDASAQPIDSLELVGRVLCAR